ncbi:uncharacterized protein [Watersipora subatra]|uniref:uncharacterized protein n=1 Tax=Watersipora subatra TaxID=2589382 RepID=UPI00355B91A6
MSFLKIKDLKKRDAIVREYLKTRQNIQTASEAEHTDKISFQKSQSATFKPLVDSQQVVSDSLINVVKAIEDLPHIPQVPQLMYEDFVPGGRDTSQHRLYGSMPSSSFMRALGSDKDHDTVFGIRMEKGEPYIGRLPITIDNNDIIIEGNRYEGTPGLWELIQSKDPQDDHYTAKDFIEYAKILWATDAMKRDNDPSAKHPKSNRGAKWAKIVKPIWENKSFQGSGTVFLPQDPTALIDRLKLLQASKQAGNTGVINELVSILDELLRRNVIKKSEYKKLSLAL